MVLSIAWVEAVDVFAFAWIDHDVVWILDVSESTVNCLVVDSVDVELIVEFRGDSVSRARSARYFVLFL